MAAKECHKAVSKYHATVETNLIRKNNVGSFFIIMSTVSLALNQLLLVQSRNQMVHSVVMIMKKLKYLTNLLLVFSQMTMGNSLLLTLV